MLHLDDMACRGLIYVEYLFIFSVFFCSFFIQMFGVEDTPGLNYLLRIAVGLAEVVSVKLPLVRFI